MQQVLIDAINDRQVLCFYHENLLREVEPFAYGINSKGKEVLRGFQVAGQSTSGRIPCWRVFEAEKMQRLYLAGRQFDGARPDYRPDDNDLTTVFAQL